MIRSGSHWEDEVATSDSVMKGWLMVSYVSYYVCLWGFLDSRGEEMPAGFSVAYIQIS